MLGYTISLHRPGCAAIMASMAAALPHLLIVDDDREICALLTKFMVRHGYRASSAGDGPAMMKALEAGRIDLVVLDLMLPGEDGLSLCRRIRAVSTLPIIMVTAVGEETDRIIGLEMGADDYLAKPFNPRELLARIKAVLRAASSTRPRMCWCRCAPESTSCCWHFSIIRSACSRATSSSTWRAAAPPRPSTAASTS